MTLNTNEIKGKVHSTESFGASDGPGVRFIVFLQGCRMRCAYCHNPDTWDVDGGESVTADELIGRALRYKSYWGKDGGITVSGGEPLLQIDFVTELFKKAKSNGIHTAIDTAGQPFERTSPFFEKLEELMDFTDLVLLDLKQSDPVKHKSLTGCGNTNIMDFAKFLSEIKKPVWIRHVLVPGVTDFDEDLDSLGDFIKSLSNVERVEVLPYHTLGRFKWDNLNIPYRLDGVAPPQRDRVDNAVRKIGVSTKK